MRHFLITLSLLALCGCTAYSFTHGHINGNGAYNYNGVPIVGNIAVDTYSCVGTCPSIKNSEIINGTNN